MMATKVPTVKPTAPRKGIGATLRSGSFLFKLIFAAALLIWPLVLQNTYDMSIMTTAGFYAMMVVAVSLILGQAGQLSLAHSAFYGIGAYVAAILATTYHWNTLLALVTGMFAAGLVAVIVGRPVLKLKYFYLALATLGLGQIFGIVVTQLSITGGANGFGPIPSLNIFGFDVSTYMRQYYVVWIIVLVVLLFTDRALKYRFGRSLRSLATSEIAASTLGVRNANWKLVAFVVGAMYCGLAGGLFAFISVAIMPGSFGFAAAVLPVVMMLVGGDQNIWGGVLGAIVLTWVINGFPQLQKYSGVSYSVVMILLLMFLPMGIAGLFMGDGRARLRRLLRMKDKEPAGVEWDVLSGERGHAELEGAETLPVPSAADDAAVVAAEAHAAEADTAKDKVLLRVENVTVQFGGLKAVNDVTMEVREGEITALIGPNGAGKTTLFNVVSRLQSVTQGQVFFEGKDITDMSVAAAARAGMARTFQNLRIFANMSVLENVLVGCHRHEHSGMVSDGLGLPGQRREERASRERAMKTLELLGLDEFAFRPAASLPYGIQRLVEIARAVASEPKLLMLDEPAAGMNTAEREYLVEKIARIRDAGITVLLVEHDIGLVMGISDAVNCLDYGKLIACGTAKVVQADEAVIAAYLGDGKSTVSRETVADDSIAAPDNLLVVDGVSTSYGTIEALHEVSLVVPKGQIVAVLGANGAGKTTLLETISGLLHPNKGHIQYQGAEITKVAPHRIARRGLGHVPEGRQLFPTLTVEDNLIMGSRARAEKAGLEDEIAFVYEVFPVLGERRTQLAGTLSGGEQQMLAIGRALTGKPSLLLLDEPSMGLAPLTVDRIFEGLVKLNEQGLTMLMVEQNAEMALSIADQAVVLQTGNVVLAERATDLRTDDRVRESYLGRGPGT
jgi:ABC-type branched-subunit amino acid transport system ATPase component/ABC-type branched-subunit amino acid transport system permease subunit